MVTFASITANHWQDGQHWDGPPWPVLFVVPLLIAVALISGALIQRARRLPSALQIVATRYAQGEIDEDEYRRRTSELRGRGSPPPTEGPK